MASTVPAQPKIYHIVHVENVGRIAAEGWLMADAKIASRSGVQGIGLPRIKRRRRELPVSCHRGLFVGDCVPFYFCPRSIMLFVIHCGNQPDLPYKGGQGPIVHLEADLYRAVRWANDDKSRWAFSLSNAGAQYAEFLADLDQLPKINWAAVAARDFTRADVKEGKQAEFLVEAKFPWHLIERIGVASKNIAEKLEKNLSQAVNRPLIEIKRDWYY